MSFSTLNRLAAQTCSFRIHIGRGNKEEGRNLPNNVSVRVVGLNPLRAVFRSSVLSALWKKAHILPLPPVPLGRTVVRSLSFIIKGTLFEPAWRQPIVKKSDIATYNPTTSKPAIGARKWSWQVILKRLRQSMALSRLPQHLRQRRRQYWNLSELLKRAAAARATLTSLNHWNMLSPQMLRLRRNARHASPSLTHGLAQA